MARKLIETRNRGPIGQLVRLVSWAIHLVFVFSIYTAASGDLESFGPEFQDTEPMAITVILLMGWLPIALFLAFINFLFRGRREYIEQNLDKTK